MARRQRDGTEQTIWDKPNIKNMLHQHVGAPIKLTRAEAKSIAAASFGARPDLPSGSRYVRDIKRMWRGLTRERRARRSA